METTDIQPKTQVSYLWFIRVDPDVQSNGIDSKLLGEIIAYSDSKRRLIYLETLVFLFSD